MEFDWTFAQNEEDYNIIDNAAAICAGVAGYKISERVIDPYLRIEAAIKPYSGFERSITMSIVNTGAHIIYAFIGLKLAESVRKKSREIRSRIQERKGDQNGNCEH